MKNIPVTKEELKTLIENIVYNRGYQDGRYELANQLHSGCFYGGLDHYVIRQWSLTLYDRGMSGHCNDFRFSVPKKHRRTA